MPRSRDSCRLRPVYGEGLGLVGGGATVGGRAEMEIIAGAERELGVRNEIGQLYTHTHTH